MCASARRHRSASPSCSTTRIAAVRTAIGSWPGRSWTMSRKVLGRGLDALISSVTATETADGREPKSGLPDLPISEIGPNPFQPLTQFADESLQELADSIKSSGVLQPV